jgi:hypothetical protein
MAVLPARLNIFSAAAIPGILSVCRGLYEGGMSKSINGMRGGNIVYVPFF